VGRLYATCRLDATQVTSRIIRTYFTPGKAGLRYSDMSDVDLIYRCLGIILESIAFSGDEIPAAPEQKPNTEYFAV